MKGLPKLKNKDETSKNKLMLLKEMNFSNVGTNMKVILEDTCFHSIMIHTLQGLIPIFQLLFLFSSFKFEVGIDTNNKKETCIYNLMSLYSLAFTLHNIFVSINNTISSSFFDQVNELKTNKKYYEIGDHFRKTTFSLILINLLFFTILILVLFISDFNLNKNNQEVISYILMNFFSLILNSFTTPLIYLLFIFDKKQIISKSILIKFVTNIFISYFNFREISQLCIFRNNLFYFSIADFISEIVTLIFIIYIQIRNNPYPQIWIHYNIRMLLNLKETFLFSRLLLNKFLFFKFVIFIWFDFMIILTFGFVNFDIEIFAFLFFVSFVNKLIFVSFHYINFRKKNILDKFQIYENISKSLLYNDDFNFELFSNKHADKLNSESIQMIKTKCFSLLFFNILGLIFYFCFAYFTNIFSAFKLTFLNILFVSMNGMVYSMTIQLFVFLSILKGKTFNSDLLNFQFLTISVLTLVSFVFVSDYLENRNFFLIAFNAGYYFLFTKLLLCFKNIDMRIIAIEKIKERNLRY